MFVEQLNAKCKIYTYMKSMENNNIYNNNEDKKVVLKVKFDKKKNCI